LFELSGGDVSLDFTNTLDSRPADRPRELIPSYRDLLSWSKQAGVLTAHQESTLRKKATRMPAKAQRILQQGIKFREILFEVASAIAMRRPVPEKVLVKFSKIVHSAQNRFDLIRAKRGLEWSARWDSLEMDSILWAIIQSAANLLTSSSVARIRRCEGYNCNWLFLDHSKRGNRRWCDMSVCGNRAKAKRHYERTRKK
jgi:predicted RNA-binding Zn ribbon-like protein